MSLVDETLQDKLVVTILAGMKPDERKHVENMIRSIIGPIAQSFEEFKHKLENMTDEERKEAREVATGVVDLVIDGARQNND